MKYKRKYKSLENENNWEMYSRSFEDCPGLR